MFGLPDFLLSPFRTCSFPEVLGYLSLGGCWTRAEDHPAGPRVGSGLRWGRQSCCGKGEFTAWACLPHRLLGCLSCHSRHNGLWNCDMNGGVFLPWSGSHLTILGLSMARSPVRSPLTSRWELGCRPSVGSAEPPVFWCSLYYPAYPERSVPSAQFSSALHRG